MTNSDAKILPSNYGLNLRVISLFLIVAFCAQDVAFAAPSLASPKPALSPIGFDAPLDFSVLKEVHQGKGPFIIHIQDAHANVSGQRNLAQTLDILMARYGISLVMVEGSSQEATLTPLKDMASSKELCARVAKGALMEGEIAGEEYLNLTSERPMRLMGIEDRNLYFESVENYAKLASKRGEMLDYLKMIRNAVEKLKRKMYPQTLLDYEAQAGKPDEFTKTVFALMKLSGDLRLPMEKYAALNVVAALQEKEKSLDFEAANLEMAALIEELGKRGGAQSMQDFIKKTLQTKNQKASQYAYFQNTLNEAKSKNISPADYSHLVQYAEHLKGFAELDLDGFLSEKVALEDAVFAATLASDENARVVRAIDRFTALLITAYNIQMTTHDFKTFKTNEPDFTTPAYLSFVNRRLAELGYMEDMVAHKTLLEEGGIALSAFYDSVDRRDIAFIRNAEKILQEQGQQSAVLISGGYHTSHLKELFKEKGFSYVVLAPIVTGETNYAKYEKLLLAPIQKEIREVRAGEEKTPQESRSGVKHLGLAQAGVRLQSLAAKMGVKDMAGLASRFAAMQGAIGARTSVPVMFNGKGIGTVKVDGRKLFVQDVFFRTIHDGVVQSGERLKFGTDSNGDLDTYPDWESLDTKLFELYVDPQGVWMKQEIGQSPAPFLPDTVAPVSGIDPVDALPNTPATPIPAGLAAGLSDDEQKEFDFYRGAGIFWGYDKGYLVDRLWSPLKTSELVIRAEIISSQRRALDMARDIWKRKLKDFLDVQLGSEAAPTVYNKLETPPTDISFVDMLDEVLGDADGVPVTKKTTPNVVPAVASPVSEIVKRLDAQIPWKELVRDASQPEPAPDNERGIRYWSNNAEARAYLKGMLRDSWPIFSGQTFKSMLSQAHRFAAAGKLGNTPYYALEDGGYEMGGILREGGAQNNYRDQARQVAEDAEDAGLDASIIMHLKQPLDVHKVRLARVPENAWPANLLTTHYYPDTSHLDAYFQAMADIFNEFAVLNRQSVGASPQKLQLIAELYQYAVNARPFTHINNSLFMNFVNLLLHDIGLNGIPHGILDHSAMRLQPEIFKTLFIAAVEDANKEKTGARTAEIDLRTATVDELNVLVKADVEALQGYKSGGIIEDRMIHPIVSLRDQVYGKGFMLKGAAATTQAQAIGDELGMAIRILREKGGMPSEDLDRADNLAIEYGAPWLRAINTQTEKSLANLGAYGNSDNMRYSSGAVDLARFYNVLPAPRYAEDAMDLLRKNIADGKVYINLETISFSEETRIGMQETPLRKLIRVLLLPFHSTKDIPPYIRSVIRDVRRAIAARKAERQSESSKPSDKDGARAAQPAKSLKTIFEDEVLWAYNKVVYKPKDTRIDYNGHEDARFMPEGQQLSAESMFQLLMALDEGMSPGDTIRIEVHSDKSRQHWITFRRKGNLNTDGLRKEALAEAKQGGLYARSREDIYTRATFKRSFEIPLDGATPMTEAEAAQLTATQLLTTAGLHWYDQIEASRYWANQAARRQGLWLTFEQDGEDVVVTLSGLRAEGARTAERTFQPDELIDLSALSIYRNPAVMRDFIAFAAAMATLDNLKNTRGVEGLPDFRAIWDLAKTGDFGALSEPSFQLQVMSYYLDGPDSEIRTEEDLIKRLNQRNEDDFALLRQAIVAFNVIGSVSASKSGKILFAQINPINARSETKLMTRTLNTLLKFNHRWEVSVGARVGENLPSPTTSDADLRQAETELRNKAEGKNGGARATRIAQVSLTAAEFQSFSTIYSVMLTLKSVQSQEDIDRISKDPVAMELLAQIPLSATKGIIRQDPIPFLFDQLNGIIRLADEGKSIQFVNANGGTIGKPLVFAPEHTAGAKKRLEQNKGGFAVNVTAELAMDHVRQFKDSLSAMRDSRNERALAAPKGEILGNLLAQRKIPSGMNTQQLEASLNMQKVTDAKTRQTALDIGIDVRFQYLSQNGQVDEKRSDPVTESFMRTAKVIQIGELSGELLSSASVSNGGAIVTESQVSGGQFYLLPELGPLAIQIIFAGELFDEEKVKNNYSAFTGKPVTDITIAKRVPVGARVSDYSGLVIQRLEAIKFNVILSLHRMMETLVGSAA